MGIAISNHQPVQAKTTYIHVSKSSLKDDPGLFTNRFYRINKKMKVNIHYSSKKDSRTIVKATILPKGTTITASGLFKKHAISEPGMTTDISYYLKRKTVSKALYGNGNLMFEFKLPTSKLTRVKRPAYVLPYGSGTMLSGGLKAITELPSRKSDALKITSDGWLEYYQYHLQSYPSIDMDGVRGTATSSYFTKPESAAKINRTLKKGANTYLYTGKKVKGIAQKKVRSSGPYKYRLTIHNHHTPVAYEDLAYGDDHAASSIYTVGGKQFYTVIAQGAN
jgi:hypothetical protein